MHTVIAVALVTAIGLTLVAFVAGAVWLSGREYDRHPWFARWMNTEAAMHGAYADQPDITPEYLDQVPGGWDERP